MLAFHKNIILGLQSEGLTREFSPFSPPLDSSLRWNDKEMRELKHCLHIIPVIRLNTLRLSAFSAIIIRVNES
jgi:hypothetical protein